MALEIHKIPPIYAMIGHGVLCQVLTDKPWTAAVMAKVDLLFPGSQPAYNSKYFELSMMGEVKRFYFDFEPDNSGEQLRMWDPAWSKTEFLDEVVFDLNRNYYIAINYNVTRLGDTGIRFVARNPGPSYNIELNATNIDGFDDTGVVAGTLDQMPVDYRALLALKHGSALIAQEMVPFDGNNIASSDFKPYINDLLATDFIFPFEPGELTRVLPESSIALQLAYAEHFDNHMLRMHYSDTFYILPGGLAQSDNDLLAINGTDYFIYMDMATRFLNWCPVNKRTAWGVPEKLYLLNAEANPVSIVATINFLDDTPAQTIAVGTLSDQHKIHEIICGLHEIAPDIDHANVDNYTVHGLVGEEQVTEIRYFSMDHMPRYKQRCFIFKNSFGVFETLRCTGELAVSDSISRELNEVADGRVYRIRVNKSENNIKFRIHTGWLQGRDHRRWLTDMLLSHSMYMIEGDFIIPVVLTTGEVERERDREFNFGLKFEFQLDFREERFSDIIGQGLHYLRDENFEILTDENGVKLIDF